MHTPVSQEEGSKLPGLPFRVLAVVNNTSNPVTLHMSAQSRGVGNTSQEEY